MATKTVNRLLILAISLIISFFTGNSSALTTRSAFVSQAAAGPRFIDQIGNPLAGERMWVLCYPSQTSTLLFSEQTITTGPDGRPLQSLPSGCNAIAALQYLYSQPAPKPGHGPAYDVFRTSWPPGIHQLSPVDGDILINPAYTLVLFRIVASLNWELAPGSTYLTELREGLRQASSYLYDLTDGQAAIGPVHFYSGGREWNHADLRLSAANDYRPTAFVGGIVPAPLAYTTPIGKGTVFVPGAIFLGRYWDGLDAFNPLAGSWEQKNAYRTIGHEWGHYAFFLFDEYQMLKDEAGDGTVGQRVSTYCLCIDLPMQACTGDASAMSYQYNASELWHPVLGQPAECVGDHPAPGVPGNLGTDQWFTHGEEDWKTLAHWGAIQHLPDGGFTLRAPLPGPDQPGLVADLFEREPGYRDFLPILHVLDTPTTPAAEISVHVRLKDILLPERVLNALYPQVYLLQQPAAVPPAGIIYQGTTYGLRTLPTSDLGDITLLGVVAGDRARIYADRYTIGSIPGGRFVYPPAGSSGVPLVDGVTLELVPETWTPGLDIDYGMSGDKVVTMTLHLKSPQSLAAPPIAQLCVPTAGIRCPANPAWRKTMQQTGAEAWSTTFTVASGERLPDFAWVMISTPDQGDFIRSFQTAGGVGPAHMLGDAPLRDGAIMVDAVDTRAGEHNQVIFMNAGDHDALLAPLPTNVEGSGHPIGGIIGQPLDVDILLPTGASTAASPSALLPTPVILTLFYSQAAIDRLAIDEANLRVLYFNRATTTWQVVSRLSSIDKTSNWVATDPRSQDGIYAIGWIQP